MRIGSTPVFVVVAVLATGCSSAAEREAARRAASLAAVVKRIEPLHEKFGKPQPGDWVTQHHETGQTFEEYVRSRPVTPTGARRVIYVQPLGDFTEKQGEIVNLSAEFLGLYFDRPVKMLDTMPTSAIPGRARRVHPSWGMKQILSTYVLDEVLKPKLPADAAALIAFSSADLWPGEGWNFVFGQANLRNRVGVWSIYRNGDAEGTDDEFRLCLLRTLKTATHETGHMFSMRHCIAYECNMCGSNHRAESDRRPLCLGPQCLAKVLFATGADPVKRFENLAEFCEKTGLEDEAKYYNAAIERLK
jgi:archaemetzincin